MRQLRRIYATAFPTLIAIMAVAALVLVGIAGVDWGP